MKKHVFLLDDDHDELRFIYEALNSISGSYKCTYASTARQALEILKYLTPDYIIADYDVPGMNGLEFLKEVKKMEHLKDKPFFVYSSINSIQMQMKALGLGAKECIKKPDTIEGITIMLERILLGRPYPQKNLN